MNKFVLDKESNTILHAQHCIIFDDANFWFDSEEEFIEHGLSVGTPVLDYRDPECAYIVWSPEDVQSLVSDLTYDESVEALQKVSRVLRESSIAHGWEVLEIALANAGYEITTSEENK